MSTSDLTEANLLRMLDEHERSGRQREMFMRMYQRAYKRGMSDAIAWFPVAQVLPPLTLEWVIVAVRERHKGSPIVRSFVRRAMSRTVHTWAKNKRLQLVEYLAWTPIPEMPAYLKKELQWEFDDQVVSLEDPL